jgi:pyruvate dehydrogenase E1 component alpha subunit
VTLAYGGDGHWASPHFHSALNEAAVASLPFIYLVENNGYLQYAANDMIRPVDTYTSVARAMGIPAEEVNGQDVLAVYNAVAAAADRARSGGGPTFIEAKTYRYYVHSGAAGVEPGQLGSFGPDPLLINIAQRPEREVRAWLAKDPLGIFRATLIEFGVLDANGADEREQSARGRVEDAYAFAEQAAPPEPEQGLDNVFAGERVPPRHIL